MKDRLSVFIVVFFIWALLRPGLCEADTYAYVANSADKTVSVIDTLNHAVINTIPETGTAPHGVAVPPTGNYVFVANQNDETISVIETVTHSIFKTIGLPTGVNPKAVAVSADGKFLYLTASKGDTSGFLRVINITNGSVTATIPVEATPFGLAAFTKDSAYICYVANKGADSVSVIEDTAAADLPIAVGTNPTGVAVSPEEHYIYVTNRGNGLSKGTVSIIRTVDNTFIEPPITVGFEPVGIDVVSVGSGAHNLYVANEGSDSVSVIEIETGIEHTVLKTVAIEDLDMNRPYGVSATPNGEYVYVTNRGSSTVSVIQTSNNMVIKTIDVGQDPTSLGNFVGSVSPPAVPTDLTAIPASPEKISLRWSDPAYDELGFEIARKIEGDEEYTLLDTVSAGTTDYTDATVEQDITYSYQVRSYNDFGSSEYGKRAKAEIQWAAPSKLTVVDTSKDAVTLSWADNSNVESGFEIERRTVSESADETESGESEEGDLETTDADTNSDTFTKVASVDTDVTKYTDSGLDSDTTYVYRVRAYVDAEGGDTLTLAGDESAQTEVSDYSNEVKTDTSEDYLCFIGTAAGGSAAVHPITALTKDGNEILGAFLLLSGFAICLTRLGRKKKDQG